MGGAPRVGPGERLIKASLCLAAALAISACGTSAEPACDGGCAGAGGGTARGCVSVVHPMPGPVLPELPVHTPLKGGVWRTHTGLHAVWGDWQPTEPNPPGRLALTVAN